MAKLESSFKNMLLALTVITCLSGAILGGVNELTKSSISAAKLAKQENAIKNVVPEFNNNPLEDKWTVTLNDGTEATIFPAKMGDETVGAAVETMTKSGFSGPITIMVGFDKEGNIVNYSVLSHSETPGLGSKMGTWFREKGSFIGKNPSTVNLTVFKDGGDIDAITAATISSRAFLAAVKNAYNAYMGSSDAQSGATSQSKNSDKGTKTEANQ